MSRPVHGAALRIERDGGPNGADQRGGGEKPKPSHLGVEEKATRSKRKGSTWDTTSGSLTTSLPAFGTAPKLKCSWTGKTLRSRKTIPTYTPRTHMIGEFETH